MYLKVPEDDVGKGMKFATSIEKFALDGVVTGALTMVSFGESACGGMQVEHGSSRKNQKAVEESWGGGMTKQTGSGW